MPSLRQSQTKQRPAPARPRTTSRAQPSRGSQRQSRPRTSTISERRRPIESDSGGTRIERTSTRNGRTYRTVETRTGNPQGGSNRDVTTEDITPDSDQPSRQRQSQRRSLPSLNPVKAGEAAGSSVGLLEAEFLGTELLIFMGLFADNSDSYSEKILIAMKRALSCGILFFFLSLAASAGPNAAKITKGLGGLIFIAVLLASPGQTVIAALDSFAKSLWTSAPASPSSNASNPSNTSSNPNAGTSAGTFTDRVGATATDLADAARAEAELASGNIADAQAIISSDTFLTNLEAKLGGGVDAVISWFTKQPKSTPKSTATSTHGGVQ